jgi:hypothetical protein
VEIRWHQGTTDADKVLAWVELGQAYFTLACSDATLPHGFGPENLPGLLADLTGHGLSDDTRTYLLDRAEALARVPARSAAGRGSRTYDPDYDDFGNCTCPDCVADRERDDY